MQTDFGVTMCDHVHDLLKPDFSDESSSTDETQIIPQIVYHRSCHQTYTSKRNISFVKSEEIGTNKPLLSTDYNEMSDGINQSTTHIHQKKTDWSLCVICHKKKHKTDWRLHKIQKNRKKN